MSKGKGVGTNYPTTDTSSSTVHSLDLGVDFTETGEKPSKHGIDQLQQLYDLIFYTGAHWLQIFCNSQQLKLL